MQASVLCTTSLAIFQRPSVQFSFLSWLRWPQDDPTDQIFVFFPEEPKVGVKTIKTLAERMREQMVQRAIMVVQSSMTPFAKQCLQEMQPKYYLELVRWWGLFSCFHEWACCSRCAI
jgi:hypothetical protein